jgi:glucans biosynthesis protein C
VPRPSVMSRSALALDNLRAVVILVVLSFHSVLAYIRWIPTPTVGFDSPPYNWRSFPIVDSGRFFGFDLFCAWQDVYLMSLMFFLSGLFVWPSLLRKQSQSFLRDRVLRLGVPYIFGIFVLMPIAFYPTYRTTTVNPTLMGYWEEWRELPFWPNGQLWFLWQLLVLNFLVAGVNVVAPNALRTVGNWSAQIGREPLRYFAALLAVSVVAYVPLALIFSPWEWTDTGFFPVQLSRPLLYAVYFFAGVGIGVEGIDCGLLAADGALARRSTFWLGAALASIMVWGGLTYLTMEGRAAVVIEIAAYLSFVIACASGCFFLIAACLRFGARRSRMLGSLSANAYSLYLVHYNFVIWLQYALLAAGLYAFTKGVMVFAGTLILSWVTVLAARRVPLGALLIGAPPPAVGGLAPSVPRGPA